MWSWRRDLNPRPSDYKSDALPTELRQPDCISLSWDREGTPKLRRARATNSKISILIHGPQLRLQAAERATVCSMLQELWPPESPVYRSLEPWRTVLPLWRKALWRFLRSGARCGHFHRQTCRKFHTLTDQSSARTRSSFPAPAQRAAGPISEMLLPPPLCPVLTRVVLKSRTCPLRLFLRHIGRR